MASKLIARVAAAVVVFHFIPGPVASAASVAAVLLAGAIGFRCRPREFGALLLLYLPTVGFGHEGAEAFGLLEISGRSIAPATVSPIVVGGAVLGVPLVVAASAAVRAAVEAIRYLRNPGWIPTLVRGAYGLWIAAMPFTVIGARLGYQEGNEAWSMGLRVALAIGGVFWGVFAATRGQGSDEVAVEGLWAWAGVAGVLITTGLLNGHMIFIAGSLCGAVLPRTLLQRRWALSLVVGMGSVVAATQITFTSTVAVLLAFSLSSLAVIQSLTRLRQLAAAVIMMTPLMFVGLILALGEPRPNQSGVLLEYRVDDSEPGTVLDWLESKTMADRFPLWQAALAQIQENSDWVAPAGRNLFLAVYSGSADRSWEAGAHNSVLEVLRQCGVAAGSLLILLMIITLVTGSTAVASSRNPAVATLLAGTLGTAAAGLAFGNYPIGEGVGFILWSSIGLALGFHFHGSSARNPLQSQPLRRLVRG